jgi:hypothetical protein
VFVDLAIIDARGSGILAARNRAHARGVDVRLVADRRAPCDLQKALARPPPVSRYGSMPAPGSRTKGADHRSPRHDHGQLQLVEMSGVQQRKFERRNVAGSRSDVCATLAGRRGRRFPSALPTRRNGAGDDRAGSARYQRYRRSVPLTTISTCRLPHCEQTSRSRQSRTWCRHRSGRQDSLGLARPGAHNHGTRRSTAARLSPR